MFDRLKCRVGIHAWSPWQYGSDGSCAQTQVCQRCHKQEMRALSPSPGD
jgi:hypothetical protein